MRIRKRQVATTSSVKKYFRYILSLAILLSLLVWIYATDLEHNFILLLFYSFRVQLLTEHGCQLNISLPVDPTAAMSSEKLLENPSLDELAKHLTGGSDDYVIFNGIHKPRQDSKDAEASRTAIIVPYRNRMGHVVQFMNYMHAFLRRQRIQYAIFLVEQNNRRNFNRGLLMNVGFAEAEKADLLFDCFIFHDVDLIPVNSQNVYKCNHEKPVHLSSAVDTLDYKILYETIFGGVVALTREQVQLTGGYPNRYFGWGGEDDDLSERVRKIYGPIAHLPIQIGCYLMFKHTDDLMNTKQNDRLDQLAKWQDHAEKDTIYTANYSLQRKIIAFDGMYIWLSVNF